MSRPGFIRAAAGSLVQSLGSVLTTSSVLCPSNAARKMSSRPADHLIRTASVRRQEAVFSARVCGITDESDTVKRLRLEVQHPDFSFCAGQWVDLFVPGVETVGGFSVCSSPALLQREGVIELAVKRTTHPPARWIHTQCRVDSVVAVRVGGEFYFAPGPCDPALDVLLVAGGVGINPLYSILLHSADLLRHPAGYTPAHTHLCYSAKNTKQLLFKNSIVGVCREFPEKFSCDFHVTRQESAIEAELQPYTSRGRISAAALGRDLHPDRTLCFICGPPPMIESVSAELHTLGLPKRRVLFEKWW